MARRDDDADGIVTRGRAGLVVALVVSVLLTGLVPMTAATASSASSVDLTYACPSGFMPGADTAVLAGLQTHPLSPGVPPVILVHGWTGSSQDMRPLAAALGAALPVTPLLFDYANVSSEWAAQPVIEGCLAEFIAQVARDYRNVGGNGKVVVVAHSMGGLAARFAAQERGVAADLAGLVTVDTPHQGSPFGNTAIARLIESIPHLTRLLPLPTPGSDGSICLAEHRWSTPLAHLPYGCATPPYLPGGIPLTEIGGSVTVERTLFGFNMYPIPLASDGVVPLSSSQGYAFSGPTKTMPAHQQVVGPPPVACTIPLYTVLQAALAGATTVAASRLNQELGVLVAHLGAAGLNDYATFDELLSGHLGTGLVELLGYAELIAPCSHTGMLTDPTSLAEVVNAVRADLGAWTDSHLTITPSSLGAVQTGMSLKEAGQAAGVPLAPVGDGFSYPITKPAAGMATLSVESGSNGPVACVIASGSPVTQVVSTPEGFVLGGSVTRLTQIYGSRAVYVPAPASGYGPVPGYVVNEDGGVLAFVVNGATIGTIMGGPPGTTPSLCAQGSGPPRTSTSPPASDSQLPILQIPLSAYSGKYPSQMGFSGDSSNDVSNISWASWTATSAVGNGIWLYESCNPDCASGPTARYPAQVVLSDPLRNIYQKVTETTSGPYGFSLTLNYPFSSDPNFGAF